jgi:hypothetical protein
MMQGLLSGLLMAIPIWAGIGIGVIVYVLHRRFTGAEILILAVAVAVEILFLRHAWSELGWRFGLRTWNGLKRVALLAGVTLAYLHYYFWDVQTQIAMLPTVTVFVPVHQFG